MAAIEISVTGQKKVGTLMREFNERFPYLGLRLYSSEVKKLAPGQPFTPYRVPKEKTLASVREEGAKGGDISITGNKKIKNLEREFETVFGLYAQVVYCPKGRPAGSGVITSGAEDEYTLSGFNEKCQADGNGLYSYGD
jgi:hypothetical protein